MRFPRSGFLRSSLLCYYCSGFKPASKSYNVDYFGESRAAYPDPRVKVKYLLKEEEMSKVKLFCMLAIVVTASLISLAFQDGPVTSTGFVCPEPNPHTEVTSTELNIFVWTEYFPQDMLDCFELVYGITLNRDEYSSNEEMYAKVSAGGSAYDLVPPTDYIIGLMIRQNLLQELDRSKLPNIGNFDEGWMNQDFDPGNKYTIPYLGGTDSIVVNTDTVENIPQSWADLWKPEYAGRMGFIED